jgi:hypothetical protein
MSRSVVEDTFGKESEGLLNCHSLLTDAYALGGDFRKSITSQQHVFKFFKKHFGPEHERTVEAHGYLKALTGRAVEIATFERHAANNIEVVPAGMHNVLSSLKLTK